MKQTQGPTLDHNHSALQLAVYKGSTELVKQLLSGFDVNARGGLFGSPLHGAVCQGDIELTTLLLDNGADANLDSPQFGRPLHAIYFWGHIEGDGTIKARALTERGANINGVDSGRRTHLHAALSFGQHSIGVVLELGADPNIRDATQTTVLHRAAQFCYYEVLMMLLSKHVDATLFDGCGQSVLYRATMSRTDDSKEKFDALVEALSQSVRKARLESALAPTVLSERGEIFDLILQTDDLDLNIPDRNGWTSLDIAKHCGLTHFINVLQGRGALTGTRKSQGPSAWSLYDRDSAVWVSEDGLEA